MVVALMNIEKVRLEIKELGRSPVAEKMYPITSDWVPMTDVLAIINRFEKHWIQYKESIKNDAERKLLGEIFGKT
jgi:hypothetical protein